MSDFLSIHGIRIPVAAGGSPDVSYQERGGEVVPAFAGNLLSSVKGHSRVWRVQTPPVSESDARYYDAILRSPGAVPFDGRFTGPVLAFVRNIRMQPVAQRGGEGWVVEFELHEAKARVPDGNLLRNPGFEYGGAYWSPATASREYLDDPTLAYTGRGCAQITVTSGGGQDAIAQTDGQAGGGSNVFVPVTPGDLITFGVWAYRVSGTGFIRPRIWPYDANKQGLPPGQINGPSRSETGEWVLSTMDWTVPEGVAFIRYDLQVLNGPTVGRFDGTFLYIRRAAP